MENKIWLTNGKWVDATEFAYLIMNSPSEAAGIALKIKDENIKANATRLILNRAGNARGLTKKTSSLAEDIFHDFTFGLFE